MPDDKEQRTVITKEMGISHKEFYDELPRFLRGIPYRQVNGSIRFQLDGKDIEIRLGPEGGRQLGPSMQLPVTPVEISFSGFTEKQIEAFLKHFTLMFLKGGG